MRRSRPVDSRWVELVVPPAMLRAAGAQVDVISLRRGRIRGVNLHEPARRVRVTKTLAEVDAGDYDALLIPVGFINPDLLRQSEETRTFCPQVRPHAQVYCHAPPWSVASILRGPDFWPKNDLVARSSGRHPNASAREGVRLN